MRRIVFPAAFLSIYFLFCTGVPAEMQGLQSLVVKEMVALDKAFKTTIDAIVQNDLRRISPAFQEVHKVRHEVEHAVKSGAVIPLPKNQKRFKEFVKLDDKFHHEVEVLVHAAEKGRMVAVKRQAHKLLDACTRCHSTFWK